LNEYNDINGLLIIPAKNRMSTHATVYAVENSDLQSSIVVTTYNQLQASINVYSDQVIIYPGYPPILGNQRKGTITVLYRNNINGSLTVTPKNKMTGRVEIIPPPIYELEMTPTKDAFVRSGIPTLNYGSEQMIVVGRDNSLNESYRSLLGFDLSTMPDNSIIVSAELRLYNIVDRSTSHQVGVYSAAADWSEYGVTWKSQPAVESLLDIQEIGSTIGYLSFDVTDKVKEWINGESENYGFILKAINETTSGVDQIYSRESLANKPILFIRYKQDVIYSFGRLPLESSIFVYAVGNKDVSGSLTIREFDDKRNMPSTIHVTNFNWMLEGNISVNHPELNSSLSVKRNDKTDILGSIIVKQKYRSDLDILIIVGNPFITGSIYIKYTKDIDGSIIVKASGKSLLSSNLLINKPEVIGNIIIKRTDYKDLQSSIAVKRTDGEFKFNSNIIINRPQIISNLIVKQNKITFINGSLTVKRYGKSLFDSNIAVSRRELISNISVVFSSVINSSITVQRSDKSILDGNLFVLYRKNLNGSINVVHATMIEGSISVLSGYLAANIIIPHKEEKDWMGKIVVRVKGISEIPSTIFVGGDNIPGSYVFIL